MADMEDIRKEIIEYVIKTKLAERCVAYQTNKSSVAYLKEELLQELYLWLSTYDLNKLCDAYENNHLNALITRWISNNWFSKTSPFYRNLRRYDLLSDEITQKELDIPE